MNKKLYSIIYSPQTRDIFAPSVLPTDFENDVLLSYFRQNTLTYKKLSFQTTATSMVKVI